MPRQKPGKSETVVLTPPEFMDATRTLLNIDDFLIDLAASEDNSHGIMCYTKETDSLKQRWRRRQTAGQWLWCNPPYDDIAPWVEKSDETCNLLISDPIPKIAMLVPASTGSNYWREHVHEKCLVVFLNGRILFLDKHHKPICSPKTGKPTPYPKDLALLLYGIDQVGYDVWDWKHSNKTVGGFGR